MKKRKQYWLIGVESETGKAQIVFGTWPNRTQAQNENDRLLDGDGEVVCAMTWREACEAAEMQASKR